jgi:hypothetical protein
MQGFRPPTTQTGARMELADRTLVDQIIPKNTELRQLMTDHAEFEQAIEVLSERTWLSDSDRQQLRILKKRKLRGRDRIEEILRGYRTEIAQG